jgi:hypothetical protein
MPSERREMRIPDRPAMSTFATLIRPSAGRSWNKPIRPGSRIATRDALRLSVFIDHSDSKNDA